MDTMIHRVDGSLKTGVYRKPTHTGRYLAYTSHHPESAKRSVVTSLFRRIDHITLGEKEKQAEEQRIYDELNANGYPATFVKRVARKLKDRQKTKVEAEQKPITLASIPYVQGISEGIRRVLAKLDIHTVMKPMKSKWSLMNKAKDGIAPQEVPGAVYAIGCQTCPKVYIGETNRTAKQRVREHKCHTPMGHAELSAVAEHVHQTGHQIYWEPRVIAKEPRNMERKVTEAIAINTLKQRPLFNAVQ